MDRREVEPELRRQVSAPDLIGSRGMPNLAVMIATSQALFDGASPASAPAVVRQRSCAKFSLTLSWDGLRVRQSYN